VHPKSSSSDNSPATFPFFDKKGLMLLLIARSERSAGFRQTLQIDYITGASGASPNTDITTVSFAADGSTRWIHTWNSSGNGAGQARGITMGRLAPASSKSLLA
jgi:hypothetical protein